MNVFWSDARCRAMWEDFGDIITFDTTFQTNRYEMPLALFVGVNHHGSSIIFACALISHEDTDTFVWVFNEWLKCMGKAPLGILTDQDKAIAKAEFGVATKNWKQIEVALHVVVHECLDPDEFDEAWDTMVEKFQIGDNSWIQETKELKKRWALAYCRDNYWAGMSSTQRSEGMNRF
ncbi:Protein FAR1-RELATED SEQUENCE 8 [Bienertia sinuspersici]